MTAPQTLPGNVATHMAAELASQPETWAQAADLRDEQARLPESGSKRTLPEGLRLSGR